MTGIADASMRPYSSALPTITMRPTPAAGAAVEHVGGTADVDPLHGVLVVPRRAHVAAGREVEDDVGGDGGDAAPHRVGVGDVDRVVSTAIEHDGVVTARLEVRNEMTTDEPSSAGDQGAHGDRYA